MTPTPRTDEALRNRPRYGIIEPAFVHADFARRLERELAEAKASGGSPDRMVSLPVELAQNVLEELYELRGERHWWRDEPRCNYQKAYGQLCAEIDALEKLLGRQNVADEATASDKPS